MSSTASPITYFNGMSTDAQSLNSSISRAVQMASLPTELLQNNVNDLTNQSNELTRLNNDIQAIQSAVASLGTAATNTISANISSSLVANVTSAAGALPGSYSLEVTSLGSYSDSLSIDGLTKVTDPGTQGIGTSNTYKLTLNGVDLEPPLTVTDNSLNGLAAAINAAGAGVQATVVNVGSNTVPDYRLSLQSDQYGAMSMQLNDGTQDLLAPTGDGGQPVQYTLNGRQIESGSRTVTLAAGLVANLTSTNAGNPATVTVANDASGTGTALQSLVSAYNTAMTELAANRGQSGGALAGQSIVSALTGSLQGLTNYWSPGSQLSSLAGLGVSFSDTTGQLSFDQSAFDSATSGQAAALATFLGSATGGGFLRAATDALSSITDPTSGILTGDINSVTATITSTNQKITAQQAQTSLLQQNLTQQMAAADAMIYQLQQQTTYFQQMFAAQTASETAGLL